MDLPEVEYVFIFDASQSQGNPKSDENLEVLECLRHPKVVSTLNLKPF